MASEWKRYRLEDLCVFINGFAFKSSDYVAPSDDTIEVFRMGYIQRGGGFKEDDSPVFVPRQYGRSLEKFFLKPGDVAIAMTDMKDRVAILGNTARITEPERFVMNQRVGCIRVKRPDLLEPRFLYFYSNWQPHVERLRSKANRGVQVNLSTAAITDSELEIPPLAEQRAIASVLGTLDDKIDLNRRMNQTLEALGRSFFKSFFLEAKETTAIHQGWRIESISHVCSTVTRGITPKYEKGSGRFIINQRVNRGFELDWSELKELEPDLEVPPEKFAHQWDVLVNCLGEGTLGRTHLYLDESDVYAVDQHMSICRPKTSALGAYLYHILSSADGQARIESLKTGSTGMTMFNISKLREFTFACPPDQLLDDYFQKVRPLVLEIAANRQQSRTLVALRDALLPKLLSGKVHVAKTTAIVR